MELTVGSQTGRTARNKVVTAEEAVRLIRDGDTVMVEGFVGHCFAEELTLALGARFLQTGSPRDLTLVFTVAQGTRQGRGIERLCYEGLLKRAIGGHWGFATQLQSMAVTGKIEAYNLPQGVIAQLLRDSAAGKPGLLTRVGLGTFVDPRHAAARSTIGPPRTASKSSPSAARSTCSTRHSDWTWRSCAAPPPIPMATSPWSARRSPWKGLRSPRPCTTPAAWSLCRWNGWPKPAASAPGR